VPLLPAPAQLTHAEKDALIASLRARLALADQCIAAQDERIAVLEARLDQQTRPPKTPGNSSKPPSQGHKPLYPVQFVAHLLTNGPDPSEVVEIWFRPALAPSTAQ
jgi:hypothetical protein